MQQRDADLLPQAPKAFRPSDNSPFRQHLTHKVILCVRHYIPIIPACQEKDLSPCKLFFTPKTAFERQSAPSLVKSSKNAFWHSKLQLAKPSFANHKFILRLLIIYLQKTFASALDKEFFCSIISSVSNQSDRVLTKSKKLSATGKEVRFWS